MSTWHKLWEEEFSIEKMPIDKSVEDFYRQINWYERTQPIMSSAKLEEVVLGYIVLFSFLLLIVE